MFHECRKVGINIKIFNLIKKHKLGVQTEMVNVDQNYETIGKKTWFSRIARQ